MKRTTRLLYILCFTSIVTGCSDGAKRFIGKHTINIPLLIRNYDFSKKIMGFGGLTNPEVHYIEVYTSKIEFYRTDDGKLSGQFKFVHPENDQHKIYPHEIITTEDIFELKNIRIESDTLIFAISAGPMQGVLFDGWVFVEGERTTIGLSKKFLPFIHKRHCTEDLIKETSDYVCFTADQPANKKALYQCQVDSLKKNINVNPKSISKWETEIDFLNKLTQ